MTQVRVGMFPPGGHLIGGLEHHRSLVADGAAAGVDHICVGDHVSFRVGAGYDGVVAATSMLSLQPELPVYVGVYLLPLRHPVTVARSLATIAELAPGRLTFGVGIGGEDRHEVEICGVDPRTRGRRMDESLTVVRELLRGEPVTFAGEFFTLDDALIMPPPSPPIPLVVGGRSEAAVSRAGRLGDGWLGIWVSPGRYAAAVEQVGREAEASGRDATGFEHGLNVWCGFADDREDARTHLSTAMEDFYRISFESFERYSPYGSPADVAEFLAPYVRSGCSAFNVIPCASDRDAAVAAVGELRQLLTTST